jgi:ribosomal protein L29
MLGDFESDKPMSLRPSERAYLIEQIKRRIARLNHQIRELEDA